MEQNSKKLTRTLLLLVALALAAGAWMLLGSRQESGLDAGPALGADDTTTAIEAELNATDFGDLEAELQSTDADLNSL